MDTMSRGGHPLVDTVSVLVPSRNSARTIAEALTSALTQQPAPMEVIVVDSESTDGTADIVAQEFPGVRLIHQEPRGPAAARNAAAEVARGEWLAFLDADDLWLPGKLGLQLAALASVPGLGMCSTDWVRRRGEARPVDDLSAIPLRQYAWRDFLRENRFQTSTALVHRSHFQAVGGFCSALDGTEDWDFWMRVARRTNDLHLGWPLVVYRDEPQSFSKKPGRVYQAMLRMLEGLGPPAGPVSPREFRRLVAWHDLRFAYAFFRQGRRRDMVAALRHGAAASSPGTMAWVFLREFLPYLGTRGSRRLGLR